MLFALFSLSLLGLSYATPIGTPEFIAYGPPVTQPAKGAIWPLGSNQSVEWDIGTIPKDAQNHTVQILLGRPDSNSEHLDIEHPLTDDIPIMKGMASIVVPQDIPTGDGYVVAVIGVSDDLSATFTISAS